MYVITKTVEEQDLAVYGWKSFLQDLNKMPFIDSSDRYVYNYSFYEFCFDRLDSDEAMELLSTRKMTPGDFMANYRDCDFYTYFLEPLWISYEKFCHYVMKPDPGDWHDYALNYRSGRIGICENNMVTEDLVI